MDRRWSDGWTDGPMDRWTDGRMDRWSDEWTDNLNGQTDGLKLGFYANDLASAFLVSSFKSH
jgi:hypothetical protein